MFYNKPDIVSLPQLTPACLASFSIKPTLKLKQLIRLMFRGVS